MQERKKLDSSAGARMSFSKGNDVSWFRPVDRSIGDSVFFQSVLLNFDPAIALVLNPCTTTPTIAGNIRCSIYVPSCYNNANLASCSMPPCHRLSYIALYRDISRRKREVLSIVAELCAATRCEKLYSELVATAVYDKPNDILGREA